jgi:hypothetical protein
MADKKVTDLTASTRVSGDDLLLVVNDPLGTPESRKVTLKNFFANVSVNQVYTASSTFKANTTFSGTTVSVSSNLMLGSTNTLDAINDRYQVANVNAKFVNGVLRGNTNINGLHSSNTMFLKTNIAANTPLTSNAATEQMHGTTDANIPAGTVWFSNGEMYVATTDNDIVFARYGHRSVDNRMYFSSSGNTAYTLSAYWGGDSSNNQTIYVYRGFDYEFQSDADNHLEIRNSANGAIFANGQFSPHNGRTYFTVPFNQQSNLVYQSTSNPEMVGTIVIV